MSSMQKMSFEKDPEAERDRSLWALASSPVRHPERVHPKQAHARRLFPAAALLLCGSWIAGQTGPSDYYVSSTGNDAFAGTSPSSAWRTIARVNQQVLQPGDSVLFEGGSIFPGTLSLTGIESGTPQDPIVFDSFGTGQGVIWANANGGLDFYNVSGIRISNLIVSGSGIDTNNGIGISFYTDLPGDVKLPWIRIDHCRITGFRRGGVSIGGYNGTSGFENVRVTFNRLDHNGNNGMAVWGFYDPTRGQTVDDYPNRSIYVGHNVFESNWGDRRITRKHTGSGIEIAQSARVLVEFNEAFDNGRLNTFSGGGPVGIWMWDVFQGVIQRNESHHNMSGTLDGGGFDLDGGCVNSWMQYNYSHDNDGPGFLVGEFPGAPQLSDVTVRYNVSERDGGRASAGALSLWNGSTDGAIRGALFHNNTVFVEAKPVGVPRAFRVFGNGSAQNSGFSNNVFYSRGANVWLGDTILDPPPVWLGNLYYADGGSFLVRELGVNYSSLAAWRAGTGHESLGGPTGYQMDPLLTAAGAGGTIGDPDVLESLSAYRLQASSPLGDLGFPLYDFGISIGVADFYGIPLVQGTSVSIGANEQ